MISLDVAVQDGDWPDESELEIRAKSAIEKTIEVGNVRLPKFAEVSVVFASDETVKSLNAEWREQDKPTNVLSFASNDGLPEEQWSPLLGDIVLAQETITREAVEQGKSFQDHLTHLIVHGFLHLVGHDHIDDEEANEMEALETHVLAALGIADPYGET